MTDQIDKAVFDREYSRLRGEAKDRYALTHCKTISLYWITETQARCRRMNRWVKTGEVELETLGFPSYRVVKVAFNER